MKITVLGSGTCIPAPNRGNAGYLVEIDGQYILLDGGSGALRKIADFGYDYREIRNVFYTHLHPDHTMDYIPMLFALKNDPEITDYHEINVAAPVGFKDFAQQLHNLYGQWTASENIQVAIREFAPHEAFHVECASVSTGPVYHSEGSIAYKITDTSGNILVYSGDTGYSAAFASFATGADVLILESALPVGDPYEKHCTPSDAAKMAAMAGARTTILTHFYPQVDVDTIPAIVRQHYHGELLLAYDGLSYSLTGN